VKKERKREERHREEKKAKRNELGENLGLRTVQWRSRRRSKWFALKFECVMRIATVPSAMLAY
jgi:hypothetical protein